MPVSDDWMDLTPAISSRTVIKITLVTWLSMTTARHPAKTSTNWALNVGVMATAQQRPSLFLNSPFSIHPIPSKLDYFNFLNTKLSIIERKFQPNFHISEKHANFPRLLSKWCLLFKQSRRRGLYFGAHFHPIFLTFNSNTNIANFNCTNCSVCLSRGLNWLMLVNLSIFVGVGRLRALPYYFKVPFSGNVSDEFCLTFAFNSTSKSFYFNTFTHRIPFWLIFELKLSPWWKITRHILLKNFALFFSSSNAFFFFLGLSLVF